MTKSAAVFVPALALCGAWLAAPALACDSTGCLLVTRGGNGVLPRHSWNVELSYRYLDQSRRLQGSEETALVTRPRVDIEGGRLLPGYHSDLEGRDSAVQLEAAYGVSRTTTLYFSAPLLTQRTHEIGHGSVVTPYDTWGFGDTVLGARQSIGLPFEGAAVAALAFKLPTGPTDLIDPFDQRILDPTLQPGSGSLDVLLSGQYARKIGSPRVDVSLSGSYQANTTNQNGYRFGNEAIVTLGLARPIGRSLAVSAQVKRLHEGRDSYRGQPVPSSGSKFTYLTGGLRAYSGRFACYLVAQFPVTGFVNETQLAPKAGVILGLSRSF